MIRKLLIAGASVLTLAVSACATATPYQPVGYSNARGGYSEQRISQNRWRVQFSGNSLTSRDTVEMYLLYRAAEITLQEGGTWFETENRITDRDTRVVGTPDPYWSGSAWGPYWRPSWRHYRGGYWSRWDPFWGNDFDVREVTRYEANAEIIIHDGRPPENDRYAFDAREVIENLGPRVVRPTPQG